MVDPQLLLGRYCRISHRPLCLQQLQKARVSRWRVSRASRREVAKRCHLRDGDFCDLLFVDCGHVRGFWYSLAVGGFHNARKKPLDANVNTGHLDPLCLGNTLSREFRLAALDSPLDDPSIFTACHGDIFCHKTVFLHSICTHTELLCNNWAALFYCPAVLSTECLLKMARNPVFSSSSPNILLQTCHHLGGCCILFLVHQRISRARSQTSQEMGLVLEDIFYAHVDCIVSSATPCSQNFVCAK